MHVNYREYLEGSEWKELREKAYSRAGGNCELCGEKAEAIHHIRYPKNFKQDNLENVIAVCGLCHRKLHGIVGEVADLAYYSRSLFNEKHYTEMICPHCKDEFSGVHPVRLAINANGNISILENSGLRLLSGNPTDRGVSIWIHFVCESGHCWVMRWQFHKGKTYSSLDLDPAIDFDQFQWSTLWRD